MIDALVIYNYSLPGESLVLNDDVYPVMSFTTEVDVRYNERVRPSAHGIWKGNTFFGKRVWHLEGFIEGQDSATYIEARRALLRMLTPKSHMFDRQAMGRMDIAFTGMNEVVTTDYTLDGYPDMPIEGLSPSRTAFQVNLKSFDPRLYGQDQLASSFPQLTVVGRTYNKTYNKTYAATVGGGDTIVTNSGDIEVAPVVTFYGPATSPKIIKVDTDGTLHTLSLENMILTSGDVVEVDFANRTAVNLVTKVSVYSFVDGEWWFLEPGNNTVRTQAFSQLSGSYVTVGWKNGYLF